jgi:sulfide-dependent adenosine diphosphate thiazole synthase
MELQISKAITEAWFTKLNNHLDSEVIIVGGGPSGLLCAAELASREIKTTLFESKLAPGGGMWGGAMLFNTIVIQAEALYILDKYGIKHQEYGNGLFTADAAEASSALIYHAAHNGAAIFTGICMEDVLVKDEAVCGVVANWTPVRRLDMHVDPLSFCCRYVLDATGHPCEVIRVLTAKNDVKLNLPQGKMQGERSMNAEAGEKACVEYTGEVYPGLYVSGMAACGVSGSNRMGPIFGGMLLSGIKAAELIATALGKAYE